MLDRFVNKGDKFKQAIKEEKSKIGEVLSDIAINIAFSFGYKPLSISKSSLKKILGKNKKVMVYGLATCSYVDVASSFPHNYKIYNFMGEGLEEIFNTVNDGIKQKCKATITNLIVENYKRKKQGKNVIPLIYISEIDCGDKKEGVNWNHVASGHKLFTDAWFLDGGRNTSISDSEIRRCYKLTHKFGPEIRQIANETIVFVRLKEIKNGKYILEQVSPQWDEPQFEENWKKSRKSETWMKYDISNPIPQLNSQGFFVAPRAWGIKLQEQFASINQKYANR